MSYQRILKRSWQIFWSYKALWIFGFILALTTSTFIGGPPADSNSNNEIVFHLGEKEYFSAATIQEVEHELRGLGQSIDEGLFIELKVVFLAVAAVLVVILLWIAIASLFRYMAETALIKMVNEYEGSGKKVSVGRGFRLGWSRATWRIFLIDLVIRLPLYIILISLFLLSLAPLLLWFTGNYEAGALGIGLALALFIPLIFIAMVISAAVTLFTQIFRRVCVLEDQGVLSSIGHGFSMVISNPKEVVVTGFIVLGLLLLVFMAMVPIFIVILPVELMFILLGLVAAGLPVAMIGGLGALLFGGPLPWIVGGAVGLPILLLFIAAPFAFVNGLREVFTTILWTLSYRELKGLPVTLEEKAPVLAKVPTPATQ